MDGLPKDVDERDALNRYEVVQAQLEGLHRAGLTTPDIAAATALSEGTIRRWRRAADPVEARRIGRNDRLRALTDLRVVVEILVRERGLAPAQARAWLTSRNPETAFDRPLDLIRDGSTIEALRAASLSSDSRAAYEPERARIPDGSGAGWMGEEEVSRQVTVARDVIGNPLDLGTAARANLDLTVTEISDELIKALADDPAMLYQLDPRTFERLIAELYRRRGFEATLTPASGDEGVDVYVVRRDDVGSTLWVVQAKRFGPDHKVGAGVVRELFGTVHAKNASAGILVTTSFFEPGAERMQRDYEYRLTLRDYVRLHEMLRWGAHPQP